MKNWRIGLKIAFGIAVMMIIISGVIGYSFLLLNDVDKVANDQANKFLVEVELAKDIKSNVQSLIYHQGIFGEDFTRVDQYEASLVKLDAIKLAINASNELVKTYPELVVLDENLIKAQESLTAFETLMADTLSNREKYMSELTSLNQAAQQFMLASNDYLKDQTTKFDTAIKTEASNTSLLDRLDKITLINDVIDLGNEARVQNFKAQSLDDAKLLEDSLENFEEIDLIIEDLKVKSSSQINLDQLESIALAADEYQASMKEMILIMTLKESQARDMVVKGESLELLASEIMEKGLEHMTNASSLSVENMAKTKSSLLLGFTLALVLGTLLNYLIIRNITSGIKGVTKAAMGLSVGDIEVELEKSVNKDEIAELTNAFVSMKEGIIQQTQAIEALANGEKGILVNKRSDKDVLNISLKAAIDTISSIQTETSQLMFNVKKGDFSSKSKEDFKGFWKELYQGVESIVLVFKEVIDSTNEYLVSISAGLIPETIQKDYQGEFNTTKESINRMIQAINLLVNDTNELIENALSGDLSYRINPSLHQGKYHQIVSGVNETLEAVTNPVYEAQTVLSALAIGDLSRRVEGDYKGDHALIKNAVNQSMDNMQGVIEQINYYLKNMSQGNLNLSMDVDFEGDFNQVKVAINQILDSFNQLLLEINEAAEQVTSASTQVSEAAIHLSQGATEQASAVEQISSSIELVANQSEENANKAKQVNEISKTIILDAKESSSQMNDMLEAMEEINKSSKDISKIIKVIDEIAFQTNILALNAAVEAARAGEHGKGFAVVAEEVRDLAARSANAAKETTALIENSLKTVEVGTTKASSTASALEKIIGGVNESQEVIEVITGASENQVLSLKEINFGVSQISAVTQTNSATAEESASSSEEMSAQAELLKGMIDRFNLRSIKTKVKKEGVHAIKNIKTRKVKSQLDRVEYIDLDDDFGKYS